MGLLLYILLFIVLYYIAKVAWKFYTVYRRLHEATKQFRDFSSGQNASAYGYSSTSRGNTSGSYDESKASRRTTTTTPTGEVVEDLRTEDEINRKIFTQEEGEYIDFEEER